ncbi:TolC family protein [Gallionella capsiferriformans]|uniref:Outer membrane efflux protein n=1 Tax=Gallionella capsiferriformans (strain ES-2) TaxID=395494 RepID=D9SEI3_GALCS|nr:TolC family protein [Gallionella capsiferriformans]ADL54959.1 outer membrane efflux protein [Gallionella capsiferriformans ES-2]
MRRRLLPLGLAALFFNPSFAQTTDTVRDGAIETSNVSAPRATEPTDPLTLKAALKLALGANAELSAAGRELEAIEATIIQAQVRPNPELATSIEDTRRATRITRLQLNQPIELGGKRAARIDAAERGRDAASAELDIKRAEIHAIVVAAFYDVLVAQERLRLAQASVELAQRATSAASRRVTAGKVSPVEETRARVAEAGVRVEWTLAGSELATARKRLAGTWGNAMPRFERVEGDLEALPSLPALADLNSRLATSPKLLRARIEVDRRQALEEVERSRRIPNVTVSLGAMRNEQVGLDQAIVGVSIPIPMFDRNQGNLLEALRRTDKSRDELSVTEIRLSNELAQTHERLNTARQEVRSLQRDILPGAQSAYDAATKGFELGKFSFLEVLDAQRTSFQAKSQYLRALAEAYRSAAEIERILGEILPNSAPATTQH